MQRSDNKHCSFLVNNSVFSFFDKKVMSLFLILGYVIQFLELYSLFNQVNWCSKKKKQKSFGRLKLSSTYNLVFPDSSVFSISLLYAKKTHIIDMPN